tara:strand:+ start:7629 stop:7817 length:189 start_codon:yes stop_codon:yes gene_type:complete
MLTVKKLIAELEALAQPDASIFAMKPGDLPFQIEGGLPGVTSIGKSYVLLAPMPLTSQEGGF